MRLRHALAAAALTAAMAATAAIPAQAAGPQPGHRPGGRTTTYTNAASSSFADTYADPSVIRGKDGWWYAYATADPLKSGETPGIGHIARTRDWVHWDYVGTIFNQNNRPSWATVTAGLWAPDVRYIGGRYVMYFAVTDTTLNPAGDDMAVGVATADSPAGPWTPTDKPVVAPRSNGSGGWYNTIDPAGLTGADGQQYLYWGSYGGGVHVTRVSSDGLTPVGTEQKVGRSDRYEGAYVVRHGKYYYLMASSANCCSGPATGYAVFAGRSTSPMGPFLDEDGVSMNASATGGKLVVAQNGNKWIGPGHNAMFTDAAGQSYLVYHALDRNNAWLTTPGGINRRPMLVDRLDWIDGWPVVNAGAGPSATPQKAPTTSTLLGGQPWDPASRFLGMTSVTDAQGGAAGKVTSRAVTRTRLPGGDLRVSVDLKGSAPVTVSIGSVRATVDPVRGRLTVQGTGGERTTSLPALTGWRTLTLESTRRSATASVSAEDLADPAATVTAPSLRRIGAGPLEIQGATLVDNLTVARPAAPVTRAVATPVPGRTLASDGFDSGIGSDWSWVRRQDDVTVADGTLNWPLRTVDLSGKGGTGGLLLREAPKGQWIAQVKVNLDLGADTVRSFQQAGMVVYNSDDDFARLGTVAIGDTRTVEYGRELSSGAPGKVIYGGSIVGRSASTMWMRIAHTTNRAGEQLNRAGISTDGHTWKWGATWTLAAGTQPRIGLYAGGGASPAVTASFDDFRIMATNWRAPSI
ncbi:glycoside hydrolase family 43 [Acidipropionibacterium acidipropionici]|uniref:Glycoside hydrolase family 43 n=1 Tax=Acidipropionibacterium acidipropionici TaxID=1748 RepID=A0AAC9ANM0_9ACTN|nr:family 43 glycosylhydrolase [Acidipropionibacterium acidipropionici]AMS05694.1 glycoside hydrolase family 43 [Acidipropionibacterium acidipropionici]AOZ47160.1 glycoside hydrolase family 43 [Acidipropionibacterium acidipropionici]AZP36736.1 glycoside hydrolase family 43 [Acidipropionibacterium acidipropionici]